MRTVQLIPVLEAAQFDLERAMQRVIDNAPQGSRVDAREMIRQLIQEARVVAGHTVSVPDHAVTMR